VILQASQLMSLLWLALPPQIRVCDCQDYADKAVILNIVHSELYRIIILPNNTITIPSILLLPHLRF
jgi:hypothetical protein